MAAPTKPISDESVQALEDAKKGKPRRFVLICKGASIVSLVAFKKGAFEKRIKKARESGSGEVYFGVVNGIGGVNLQFTLARSDGFSEPPGKEQKLRDFLLESADLKFKPTYAIVDEPVPLPFDEEDLKDPLIARFMALAPDITKLLDAHPDLAAELESRTNAIRLALQDESTRDSAAPLIDALERFLLEQRTPPTTVETSDQRQRLLEAMKKLSPLVQATAKSHPDRKTELLALTSQFQEQLQNEQWAQAQATLLDLGRLVKSLSATPVAPPLTGGDAAADRWNREWPGVEARYLSVVKSAPADLANKLRVIATYATEQAAAGQFEKALQSLGRLLPLLDSVLPSGPGDRGEFVVFQQCRLAWDETRKKVQAELKTLEQSILQVCREEPDFAEIAAGTQALYTMLDVLDESLSDALDDALNATDAKRRQRHHAEARGIVDEYLDYVQSNDLIQDIDTNGFVAVAVRSTLTEKLNELRSKLASQST